MRPCVSRPKRTKAGLDIGRESLQLSASPCGTADKRWCTACDQRGSRGAQLRRPLGIVASETCFTIAWVRVSGVVRRAAYHAALLDELLHHYAKAIVRPSLLACRRIFLAARLVLQTGPAAKHYAPLHHTGWHTVAAKHGSALVQLQQAIQASALSPLVRQRLVPPCGVHEELHNRITEVLVCLQALCFVARILLRPQDPLLGYALARNAEEKRKVTRLGRPLDVDALLAN